MFAVQFHKACPPIFPSNSIITITKSKTLAKKKQQEKKTSQIRSSNHSLCILLDIIVRASVDPGSYGNQRVHKIVSIQNSVMPKLYSDPKQGPSQCYQSTTQHGVFYPTHMCPHKMAYNIYMTRDADSNPRLIQSQVDNQYTQNA